MSDTMKSRGQRIAEGCRAWSDELRKTVARLIDSACAEAVAEAIFKGEVPGDSTAIPPDTFRRDLAADLMRMRWGATQAVEEVDKMLAALAAPKEAGAKIYHASRGKGDMLCGAGGVLFMADSPATVTCPACLALMGGGK